MLNMNRKSAYSFVVPIPVNPRASLLKLLTFEETEQFCFGIQWLVLQIASGVSDCEGDCL